MKTATFLSSSEIVSSSASAASSAVSGSTASVDVTPAHAESKRLAITIAETNNDSLYRFGISSSPLEKTFLFLGSMG
jgi:hypothetical protein